MYYNALEKDDMIIHREFIKRGGFPKIEFGVWTNRAIQKHNLEYSI